MDDALGHETRTDLSSMLSANDPNGLLFIFDFVVGELEKIDLISCQSLS